MAKKLSVQIALEGAEQIQRDLAAIGDVGVEAWLKISKAAKDAGGFSKLDTQQIKKILDGVGVTTVDTVNKIQAALKRAVGFEKLTQGIQSAERAIGRLTNAWRVFSRVIGPASAIGAAVAGLNSLAGAAENTIVALGNLAARGGTSIARIDAMRQAFMTAGGSAEQFSKIFEKMVGTVDSLKADKLKELAEAMTSMKAAGWGDDAILKWADEVRAEIDRMAPAGKTASDRFAELGKRLAALPTLTQQLAVLQREGIDATQQNVAALIKYGETIKQVQGNARLLTQDELNRALAQQQATTQLANAWLRLNEIIGSMTMGTTLTNMLTGLVRAFTEGMAIIDAGFRKLPAVASAVGNGILAVVMPVVTTISQAWQGFVMIFKAGLAILQSAWDGIKSAGVSAMEAINSAIDGTIGWIKGMIDWIGVAIEKLLTFLGLKGDNPNPGQRGATGRFAGGGRVGGRGSGTSDSNLAWVSRGEHIMPARAVRQPGVLAFLEALRRSGGNLSRVLDGMGRFALGGMVPRSIPTFAGGGLVGGMSNVTIQFPGLDPIGGLRAPSGVVDELRRAAALAQVRSGGRKPSRYS